MPTVTANGDPKRPAGAIPLGLVNATIAPFVSYGQHGGANRRADGYLTNALAVTEQIIDEIEKLAPGAFHCERAALRLVKGVAGAA